MQLSKDLLGAYDEVSAMGRTVRMYMIPFYSFLETNLKRYFRMYANPIASIVEGFQVRNSAGKLVKLVARDSVKLLYRIAAANALMALMTFVNRVWNKEDDDLLPEETKARPHFTFGRIGDNIIAFTRLGNVSEMLEWVGLDDLQWTEEDLYAPINKVWGALTPFIKTSFELATKKSYYPKFQTPTNIRDQFEYFFNALGVGEVYSAIAGKPSRSNFYDVMANSIVYSYDYQETAYWDTIDAKYTFQKKSNTQSEPNPKSNALYYLKKSVRFGDEENTIKYLKEYFKQGGTGRGIAASFAAMNPIYGFTTKDTIPNGRLFVASLDDVGKDKLKVAYEYYKTYLAIPDAIAEWLRKESTTEEAAVAYLEKYFKKSVAANKK
jgi:hypothetical protein